MTRSMILQQDGVWSEELTVTIPLERWTSVDVDVAVAATVSMMRTAKAKAKVMMMMMMLLWSLWT